LLHDVLGVVSNNFSGLVTDPLTTQVSSSSQPMKLVSSVARHHSSRHHPYLSLTHSRTKSSITDDEYCILVELLQCHTSCQYKCESVPSSTVNPYILESNFESGTPAFASYVGLTRSTCADVHRVFGELTSLVPKDDNMEVVYTADDLEKFDERKRLANELDKLIDDVIVIDQ